MKNLEFIAIHQTTSFLHEISTYYSIFEDTIVNGSFGNIGERTVFGIEYRGKINLVNPLFDGEDITAQLYYTYTDAQAQFQYIQSYNEDGDQCIKKEDDLGDIAPHKISFILDFPLSENWGFNIQANWISDRVLYSENPLRSEYNLDRSPENNRGAKSYLVADAHLSYHTLAFETGIRIENIFGESYYHPGVEGADSGDNFDRPSAGFINSLIPQVKKPTVMAYLTFNF